MKEVILKLKSLHPAQQQILDEAKRFNVLKCGRRFGKTELTKELAIQPMLDGYPVGYWAPTYKDLYEVWNDLKYTLFDVIESKDETVKQIKLVTGGLIDMWSLEDPNNGRGRKYKRAIVDEAEKAKKLEEAWQQTIRATLTDYKGDAWFMSTPKFGRTYFKKLSKMALTDDTWASWKKSTYENPFMDPAEIDEARNQLDELTFECEYMAEDVDIVNKPFCYAFSEEKHVGACEYNQSHELYLSFDFNKDPITCLAIQHYDNKIHVVKAFKLRVSDIYELCDQINAYFSNALMIVTGDATGKAGSAMVKDNMNYYTVIKGKLNLIGSQLKVPSVNPRVEENRVLVNSLLQNYPIVIDKANASDLVFDLKYVEVDENADIVKDRSSEAAKADLLDCFRYYCNTFHKDFLKIRIMK